MLGERPFLRSFCFYTFFDLLSAVSKASKENGALDRTWMAENNSRSFYSMDESGSGRAVRQN